MLFHRESTLLANEDAGCGGGCGAPLQDLKRRRSTERQVTGNHTNNIKEPDYDETGTNNVAGGCNPVMHDMDNSQMSASSFNSHKNINDFATSSSKVDVLDENQSVSRTAAVGLC